MHFGEQGAAFDPRQHFVVTRFGPHIDERQAKLCQLPKLRCRFLAQIAWQAITRHPPYAGQIAADRLKHGHEATGGKRHRIAVGQENTLDAVAKLFAAAQDAFEHFLLATGTEALLWGRVHFAECAPVPGTAVSHRQDQRIRFAWRAVDGFDIADGDHGHA